MADPTSITQIIKDVASGDRTNIDQLLAVMYDDLHALAARSLRGERPDHTLQATALVHEVYLKLIDQHEVDWRDRNHFFALASEMIRRILVDHARAKKAVKRGGDRVGVSLEHAEDQTADTGVDLVALDDALNELKEASPQQARVVEMRFFGGLKIEEIAEVLDIGKRTVDREWAHAKAWLYRKLKDSSENADCPEGLT